VLLKTGELLELADVNSQIVVAHEDELFANALDLFWRVAGDLDLVLYVGC